jgi:hypothetical protein
MKLSEEFFKIKDAYKSIRDKLYHIIYYMHPLCEDIDIEIKHFSQIGWNKNEIKTLCVYYNIYVNGIDYTSSEKEIPIEWLDLDDNELKTTIRKYLYDKELKKKQLEAEANEARDRREYERLKKKYEG